MPADARALTKPTDTNMPGPGVDVEELRRRIFANTAGTYGEGAIGEANRVFKELQDQLSSGKITQQQYVDVAGQLAPEVKNHIYSIASRGSREANAAEAAGASTFNNDTTRDLDIYKTGRELLGRDLTKNELYSLRPKFSGPNGADTGKAYLAELADQEAKSPEALAKNAPSYSPQVNDMYTRLLGRAPTAAESSHYGSLLASGDMDQLGVEQQVQAGQEYQGGQDKKFREGLKTDLQGFNQTGFDKAKEGILSTYTKAGLQNSSDLDFAIANAMKELNQGSDQFLSGLSSSQYGGNKEAARGDYQTMLNTYLGNKANATGRSNSLLDYYTQRADQGTDYQTQMNDYMSLLDKQPKKRRGGIGGALGPLVGMGAGALLAGPGGAAAGAQLGGQFGQAGGGMYDYLMQ